MSKKYITDNIKIDGQLLDGSGSAGTSGQILSSTGTATDWISLSEISGVDGTGTANYIAKWSDVDTIGNSIIYDNGTNVGIGTTSLASKLEVNGDIRLQNYGRLYLWKDNSSNYIDYNNWITSTGATQTIQNTGSGGITFKTSTSARMFINSSGDVGIGTTSPTTKLDILRATGAPSLTADNGAFTISDTFVGAQMGSIPTSPYTFWIQGKDRRNNGGSFPISLNPVGGNVGIGTTNPTRNLSVYRGTAGSVANFLHYTDASNFSGLYIDVSNTDELVTFNASGDTAASFAFETGNNERMRITSTGNVGIGTTSPGAKLDVYNAGNSFIKIDSGATSPYMAGVEFLRSSVNGGRIYNDGGAVQVKLESYFGYDSANPTRGGFMFKTAPVTSGTLVDAVRIDARGYVGIGTDSPTSILDASVSNGAISGFRFKGYSDSVTPYLLSLGTQTYQDIFQIKSVNGLVTMGIVGAVGYTPDLAFQTNSTERMRITSTGTVGIGTTSPLYTLDVTGSARIDGILRVGTTAQSGRIHIIDSNGKTFSLNSGIVSNNNFSIREEGTSTDMLVIEGATGNVGIGTTGPAEKLHIAGNGLFTGTLEVDTVNNGVGDFLTRTSGGIVTKRTAAEVRSDIQASQYFTVSSGSWIAASTSGWFRLASTSGNQRGSARVILSFIGGSFAPQNYIIDVTKDWTTIASLRVDVRAAQTRWITGVRVTQDTVNTSVYHLEANFASSSNPYEFRLTFDNAYGYNSTWTMATTAPLVASTNGTVILSKDIFASGNYSTDLINTGNINISGNTLSSIDTNGNIILSPNGTGNVGIGTTSPGAKLEVSGTVKFVNSGFAGFEAHNTNGTWESFIGTETGGGGNRYNSASSQHTFYNNSSAVVRIDSNGNVGIGTTIPAYKLDVAGAVGINTYIHHNDDTDTFIGFATTDEFSVNAGGVKQLSVTSDNVNIEDTLSYTRPSGNTQFNGEIVNFGSFAETTAAGDLICLGTDAGSPVWRLANNGNSVDSTGMLGIALGSTPDAGILVRGFARLAGYSVLTDGGKCYISSTNGDMTTIAPSGSGTYLRIVGYVIDSVALSHGEIYFCPDNTWVEITA